MCVWYKITNVEMVAYKKKEKSNCCKSENIIERLNLIVLFAV